MQIVGKLLNVGIAPIKPLVFNKAEPEPEKADDSLDKADEESTGSEDDDDNKGDDDNKDAVICEAKVTAMGSDLFRSIHNLVLFMNGSRDGNNYQVHLEPESL